MCNWRQWIMGIWFDQNFLILSHVLGENVSTVRLVKKRMARNRFMKVAIDTFSWPGKQKKGEPFLLYIYVHIYVYVPTLFGCFWKSSMSKFEIHRSVIHIFIVLRSLPFDRSSLTTTTTATTTIEDTTTTFERTTVTIGDESRFEYLAPVDVCSLDYLECRWRIHHRHTHTFRRPNTYMYLSMNNTRQW